MLNVYVHTKMDENTFFVGDNTGQIPLKFKSTDEADKILEKSSYRIIQPEFKNDILWIGKIQPIEIKPINVVPLASSEIPKASAGLLTFDNLQTETKGYKVEEITVKVVNISPTRMGPRSANQFRLVLERLLRHKQRPCLLFSHKMTIKLKNVSY
jgi:hypothetical protein